MKRFPTAALPCVATMAWMVAQSQTATQESPPTPVKAMIDSGVLVGETRGGINVFRGVSYAKPPVGELRWKAAVRAVAITVDRAVQALTFISLTNARSAII